MSLKVSSTFVFCFGLLMVVARASMLAGWDVHGLDVRDGAGIETNGAPFCFYATTSSVDLVTAHLSLGDGVNPSTANGVYGFKISAADQTNSLAGAIASDHFMEFSLEVDAGCEISLESVEINGEGTSTACSNVVFISSVDGFTSGAEIASVFPANRDCSLDTDESGFGAPIDLSAEKYQHLSGIISFRVYGWNSSGGTGEIRIRDLTGIDLAVYGEVSILPLSEAPVMSIRCGEDRVSISVIFEEPLETEFYLQRCDALGGSNSWSTICGACSDSTNFVFDVGGNVELYRMISE